MNKTKAVLQYLREHSLGITTWDAINLFHATRLSAIIFNLKKDGYVIDAIPESSDDAHWVRYILRRYAPSEVRGTHASSISQETPPLFSADFHRNICG